MKVPLKKTENNCALKKAKSKIIILYSFRIFKSSAITGQAGVALNV